MKFIVVCDEKPKKCDDCPFYQETLAKAENAENQFNIIHNCFLGATDKCPLTEVNTIWSDKPEED